MTNPAGTRFEVWLRDHILKTIWPTVKRAPKQGALDDADYIGCGQFMLPLMVEAKWRKTTKGWRISKWVAEIRVKQKRNGQDWIMFVAEDMRVSDPVMVCDAQFGRRLLAAFDKENQ
jgi:hypothetical protein